MIQENMIDFDSLVTMIRQIFIEVSMTKITQNSITNAPWSEITLSNLELIIIEQEGTPDFLKYLF
jgi:hypothetical protein